jgi:UPF0288 family protein (methanogenesis marker protein 3)
LARIQLYDQAAPKSARLFRIASGMAFSRIGSLRVAYPYSPLVGAVLMINNPSAAGLGRIESENVPREGVHAGDIGMTNSVKERAGVIGIRVDGSKEFGPTCESLDSTNVVGRVVKGSIRIAKEAKEGEEVHLIEVGRLRSSLPRA